MNSRPNEVIVTTEVTPDYERKQVHIQYNQSITWIAFNREQLNKFIALAEGALEAAERPQRPKLVLIKGKHEILP